jgi:hypothetical protein
MDRRRALGTLAGLAVLPLLAACPGQPPEEAEDCDAGDLIEGDEDCYGKRPKKPKPKQKTAPKK